MPRLRQLPKLYLRGALANETMKHLDPDQRSKVEQCTVAVFNAMGGKQGFAKALAGTIGGDYKDDPAAGEQDMLIAIWKGVVSILYHENYQFMCNHCSASEYTTLRGLRHPINRRTPFCPACNHVQIADPGTTGYAAGQYVHKDLVAGTNAKTASPIAPLPQGRKYSDDRAQAILDDESQISRYFNMLIWNYLRQILNENDIKSQTTTTPACYPADLMAVYEILSLLGRHGVKYRYVQQAEPMGGWYTIQCNPLGSPPGFTGDLTELLDKYSEYGVEIDHSRSWIRVRDLPTAPMVNSVVTSTTPVLISTTHTRIGNGSDDSSYTVEHLDYKVVGGTKLSQESPMLMLERSELLETIRYSLPDEAKPTYDILTEGKYAEPDSPDTWSEFSSAYPEVTEGHKAKNRQIAQFLGLNPRKIEEYKSQIGILMKVHQVGVDERQTDEHDD